MKKWQLKTLLDDKIDLLGLKLPELVVKLLYNRGLKSQSQIEEFFDPDYSKLHDPFLFNDMTKAVTRILKAIQKNEKIMIYGDYDADGVTSSAIIYTTLKLLTENVFVYIPHREKDGYGLNENAINDFAKEKVALLITVDCGVTNVKEVALAKELKIDVIVTDHHEQLEILPKALAIIDPKVKTETYPCKFLAGAAVAYKLATAIIIKAEIDEEKLAPQGGKAGFLKWLLDLVGIGTVADVVPLLEENRVLAKYGLLVLAQTKRPGLIQLAKVASIDFTKADSFTIGYQIAPRLNAAGRLGHAQEAFDLLVCEDMVRAQELACQLNKTNLQRQKITEEAMATARLQLAEQLENQMLFIYEESIMAGVIGLVAGRLCEEYYKPILVMTMVNGKIVGSGRSIEYFNIVESLFANEKLLSRYGGHAQACGFTLLENKNLEKFKNKVHDYAVQKLKGIEIIPIIPIDLLTTLSELTMEFVSLIDKFQPFGEGNEKPRIQIDNLLIMAIDFLGEEKKHLRFLVKDDSSAITRKILAFGQAEKWSDLRVGNVVDVVVEVNKNVWNGQTSVEMKLIDLRLK